MELQKAFVASPCKLPIQLLRYSKGDRSSHLPISIAFSFHYMYVKICCGCENAGTVLLLVTLKSEHGSNK